MKVAAHQKIHCLTSALHTPRGVDARTDLEDDIADSDILICELTEAYDAAQTEVGIRVQPLQTVIGHDTVFIYNRHNVGRDAHRTQIEQRLKLIMICQAIASCESLHKLEAHTATRQMAAWISRPRHLRIKNSHSIRQRVIRHMMVTDNEIDTLLLSISYLLNRLNAAIKHDDKFHIILSRIIDAFA